MSAGQVPLAIDDVVTETRIEHEAVPLGVSQDGQLLAYTTARTASPTTLWVLNLQTRAHTNVSEGLRSASSPIWSPDGQFLAFFVTESDDTSIAHNYEVWVWHRSDSSRRQLVGAIASPLRPGHLVWTADSRFLITDLVATTSLVEVPFAAKVSQAKESKGTTVHEEWVNLPSALVNSSKEASAAPATPKIDIGRIDIRTGALERVAKGVSPQAYAAAPNGVAVAMLTQDFATSADDLWLSDPRSGQFQKSIPRVARGWAALSWSPNGRLLAVQSTNQSWNEEPKTGVGICDVIQVSTGNQTKFSVDAFGPIFHVNIPLWTDQSDAVVLVEAGKIVRHPIASPETTDTISIPGGATVESLLRGQLSTRLSDAMVHGRLVAIAKDPDGVSMHVATIDPTTKAVSLLGGDVSFYDADTAAIVRDTSSVVLGVESPSSPVNLFLLDLITGKQERLTHLNPQYDRYVFGNTRIISYENVTGEPRTAILLLPADYHPGIRYPTIVFGRERAGANYARHFGLWGGPYNMQLYTTRGYVVLYPDIAATRTPRERVTSDVLPAIDAGIATGVVDPERLALYGHSLGAYHAMMLLVQTNRFKAAIVSQGFYNLFTHYTEETEYTEGFVTGTFGPPWRYPDRYIANSPYLALERLTTPVLLVGSSGDAFPAQGDALFAALQRANKPAEYIFYEGEAHNAGTWSSSNQRDYLTRTLEWLGYWLSPAS